MGYIDRYILYTLYILYILQQAYFVSAWTPRFHLGRPMFGMKIHEQRSFNERSTATMTDNVYGIGEGFFAQKLDHFDNTSTATWSQHYFFNFQYQIGGSKAVFLMLGGEGPESSDWVTNTKYPFVKWAKQYGAAMFILEHRYYGKSRPTPNQSVRNLRYLSSRQAIEDIAEFIRKMEDKFLLNNATWITFGGSYSGALSLWAREKHPELIAGAVGSSAPVRLQLDFWKYLQVVEDSLRQYSNKCAENIREAFQSIEYLMNSEAGRENLTNIFVLNPPFANLPLTYNDIQNFYSTIYGNFQEAVQYSGDNIGVYKYRYGIAPVCFYMTLNNSDPLINLQRVNKYMAGMHGGFKYTSNSYDEMISYLKNEEFGEFPFDSGARSWTWQTCTEFGYFQSTDGGPNGIFGSVTPVSFFLNMCRDVFGQTFDSDYVASAIHSTLTYYGGGDGYKGTNVVIPNGSLDPWHALGIYTSNDPSVVWYLINGTAHCADMYPEAADDVPGLKIARALIENNIGSWLTSPRRSSNAEVLKSSEHGSKQWIRPKERSDLKSELDKGTLQKVEEFRKTDSKKWLRYQKMHLGRPPHGFLPDPDVGNAPSSVDLIIGYFTQPVDHFDPQNPATFKQQFYENSQWAKPGGPMFLMIGGEGPASPSWVLNENITYLTWAKKFGATVYLLEHRYYGRSIVGGMPYSPNPDLKYLSSLQMLYDVANFIRTVNLNYSISPKWITFGGSYSGSLSLWMREVFPELVHGAVGSSAPVEAKLDFYEYLEVVEASIRSYDQHCAENIAKGFDKMHQLAMTKGGRKNLSDVFTLEPPWDNSTNVTELDRQFFFSNIYSQFQGVVQYSGDNTGPYASGYGIPDMCVIMTNDTNDPLHNIAAFNELMTVFYQGGGPFQQTENSYEDYVTYLKYAQRYGPSYGATTLWTWQTCTEFGYFQSSDSSYSIFGSPTPVNMFAQMCSDVFGDKYSMTNIQQSVIKTNQQYGGRDRYKGTNVVIPNGSNDPWHALGKYTSNDPSVVWFLINGTAHCADMYPARAADVPDLAKVRTLIEQNIAKWIADDPSSSTATTTLPTFVATTTSPTSVTTTTAPTTHAAMTTISPSVSTAAVQTTKASPTTTTPRSFSYSYGFTFINLLIIILMTTKNLL